MFKVTILQNYLNKLSDQIFDQSFECSDILSHQIKSGKVDRKIDSNVIEPSSNFTLLWYQTAP